MNRMVVNFLFVNALPLFVYFIVKSRKDSIWYKNRDIWYFVYLSIIVFVLYILLDKKILILIPIVSTILWIVVLEKYYIKAFHIEKEYLQLVSSLTDKLNLLKEKHSEVDTEDKKISEELNKYTNLFILAQEINESINLDKIGYEFYSKITQYFGNDKITYTGLIIVKKKEIIEVRSYSSIDEQFLALVKTTWTEKQDFAEINDLSFFRLYNNHLEYILLIKHKLTQDEIFTLNFFINETKMGFIRGILFEEVEKLSRIDGLTGLYLRRYFISRLNNEILRATRYNTTFSLIMIDIDFFKKVNDTYGHIVGDFVLKEVAKIFVDTVREQGFCSRWGGEEFLIFVPYQEKQQVKELAEQIRKNVENAVYQYGATKLKITVSCGISMFPQEGNKIEQLIEIADKKLYHAKQTGRNKVVI